ncbi:IucA/IucC family siderophore biosynthesis protein [Streptomyces sp. NBC_00536]|uniref:IucA/IucC family siderophore biosynthesis protein n=1 Tax=Streptomyces sp. NBC_00536 TaxID=2975769 RepID=UPI002E8189E8|nr:IucA/IucC family siderophore biosynthesis protein [Streptomyces sp. NBC_00536]WUC82690.1 IucA/IucC family siderophore biosynthesis protein [Streptomyces sp. NBC_00536]
MCRDGRSTALYRSGHAPGSAAEEAVAARLDDVRPTLGPAYAAALPGARAAVLTRLWRALAFEPLPWVVRRSVSGDAMTVLLAGGGRLRGPLPDPYASDAYVRELDLDSAVHTRASDLMAALGAPNGAGFAAELDGSTASLALSRAGQSRHRGPDRPAEVWEWEQRVVDGHPYHPNCRYRPGFSVAEELAYAPEHRPVVTLGLRAVRADETLLAGAWPAALRDGARILVPVHPWQAEHVPGLPGAAVGGAGFTAHPLMALRSLAPVAGGPLDGFAPAGAAPQLKTALSTRLTSSVRDISAYSIETAQAVSDFAGSLAARLDGRLHVTRTLGAVTSHSPDLAAVLREPPERYADTGAGERVVPVGALAGTSWARSPAWRAAFARLALSVCLRVLDLGVALEAHGQNLLVVLSPAGEPLRLVYRDLADIRISPARLAAHGIPAPPLAGRLVTDDETLLRRKLFGSLVTGALGALAGSAGALAEDLAAAAPALERTPDTVALLTGPLPAKALTLMRLSPQTPGDLWTTLGHPSGPGGVCRISAASQHP